MHAFITKLEAFIQSLSPENDELSSRELFLLLEVLLWHHIRTSASESLARQLDAKFEQPRMDCFRACLALNQLNQTVFDFICAIEDLQALPNKANLLGWLKENNLMTRSESAIFQLEQTSSLSPYLTKQDTSSASAVSKGLRSLFQPALNIKAATELGQFIIYADLKNAEQLIIKNPSLLKISVNVKDYSDRQISGTALQLALGAKDVRFHENEIAMVEMITRYLLEKFSDGAIIMAQQIIQQFPEGWEAAYEARCKRDRAALDAFVAAIAGSEDFADWEAAAVIYRDHFDNENKGHGIMKTGFHYNEQAVLAWFEAYYNNYEAFGNDWNSPKNRFLWQKGSYCERYLTAADAMAYARDIYEIVKKDGRALDRCLDFLRGNGHFYPLDDNPLCLIGHHCGAVAGQLAEWSMVVAGPGIHRLFKTMSDKKHQHCEDLCKSAAQDLKQNSVLRSSTPI